MKKRRCLAQNIRETFALDVNLTTVNGRFSEIKKQALKKGKYNWFQNYKE